MYLKYFATFFKSTHSSTFICWRPVGFYIATCFYTPSTLLTACVMCTVLSVYFYIVVYTSTLLVFTLLWKSSPFPSEIPSLSLSPGLQRLARGFCHLSTTKHVSWILLWRLEKAARVVCIAAFRTDGRTYRRMDGWMDGSLGVEKETHTFL